MRVLEIESAASRGSTKASNSYMTKGNMKLAPNFWWQSITLPEMPLKTQAKQRQ